MHTFTAALCRVLFHMPGGVFEVTNPKAKSVTPPSSRTVKYLCWDSLAMLAL